MIQCLLNLSFKCITNSICNAVLNYACMSNSMMHKNRPSDKVTVGQKISSLLGIPLGGIIWCRWAFYWAISYGNLPREGLISCCQIVDWHYSGWYCLLVSMKVLLTINNVGILNQVKLRAWLKRGQIPNQQSLISNNDTVKTMYKIRLVGHLYMIAI